MIEPKSNKWFIEYTSPDEGHIHGIKMIHYASQTKYQKMEIMDSGSYGRCLVLDGKMQSTVTDEFIYHEGLVHPAMLTHPNPKRVFIVGGGEGATLREVLRHKSVEYCMMVDIDQEVVEKSKELLPEWHQGAFDDPRPVPPCPRQAQEWQRGGCSLRGAISPSCWRVADGERRRVGEPAETT
jgi:spermidine synthase